MGCSDGPRDPIAGPDSPESPFPLKLRGPVIKGFGRGSKEVCHSEVVVFFSMSLELLQITVIPPSHNLRREDIHATTHPRTYPPIKAEKKHPWKGGKTTY